MSIMSASAEELTPQLETVRSSLRSVISGQLGHQLRQLASKLSSLSTLSKLSLGCGAGILIYWLFHSSSSGSSKHKSLTSLQPVRKKRVRQSSTSTWQLTSDTSSVVSRPSYNWAELQKASVSDQESVVSGATLVDGTHLAPQQLGLMGMEALETVIR